MGMFKLIDSRILDINAEKSGIDMEKLMNYAGGAVADFVISLKPRNILTMCGSGNNGGDGYTASMLLLRAGMKVSVFPVKEPETSLARKKFEEFKNAGGIIIDDPKLDEYDIIIDAMLGIGIIGIPKEPYASAIQKLNNSKTKIVSVDIPSGFPSAIAVKPDYTVTMQFIKEGMDESKCGKIIVADVGFPKEVIEMIGPGDIAAFPVNGKNSHKGDNGILVIVSGSNEYYGAPLYVSKSALRMGPDMVFLFTPSKVHGFITPHTQDIMIRKSGIDYIEYTYELMKSISERATAVAIGPGISKNPVAIENAAKIIEDTLHYGKKMVIDADALAAISGIDDFKGLAVLTPHRGEFKNTFLMDPSEENVKKVAQKINATLLVKGPVDIVTDGSLLKRNRDYHHESMTRGGTGDLVTGAAAGLLSRGLDTLHSAFLSSYIIGSAGLLAFKKKGYSYYTSELIDFIPDIINARNSE
jgi:NAD(P)H-hydrate epimerase